MLSMDIRYSNNECSLTSDADTIILKSPLKNVSCFKNKITFFFFFYFKYKTAVAYTESKNFQKVLANGLGTNCLSLASLY